MLRPSIKDTRASTTTTSTTTTTTAAAASNSPDPATAHRRRKRGGGGILCVDRGWGYTSYSVVCNKEEPTMCARLLFPTVLLPYYVRVWRSAWCSYRLKITLIFPLDSPNRNKRQSKDCPISNRMPPACLRPGHKGVWFRRLFFRTHNPQVSQSFLLYRIPGTGVKPH